MLTKSEQEWLADREKWNFKLDIYGNSCFCPSCKHCEHFTETVNGVLCQHAENVWIYNKLSNCPLVPSKELLLEAAEFESKVAAKLAVHHLCTTCPYPDGPSPRPCGWCLIKRARLQVEEEIKE